MSIVRFLAIAICVSQIGDVPLSAAAHASKTRRPKSPLVVEMPPLEFVPVEQLRASTAQLLSVATSLPAYECRLSGEALNAHVPREVKIAAPFRDVIVQVPVSGRCSTNGTVWVESLPNHNEIDLVVHFSGTTIMRGVST
ncbi:MAG TPA: hypothetical protein VGJ26_05890, partial [Pirellulales bacterium]